MIHYILLKNFSWLIAIIVCDNVICCILGFNSSPPSAAYMRQRTGSSLVQVVMACRLFGAEPLPEPTLVYCQLLGTNFNENRKSVIFIQENAFENIVCQTDGHFSRGRWINQGSRCTNIPHMAKLQTPKRGHHQFDIESIVTLKYFSFRMARYRPT